jgi:hypothetical protein
MLPLDRDAKPDPHLLQLPSMPSRPKVYDRFWPKIGELSPSSGARKRFKQSADEDGADCKNRRFDYR